MEGTQPAQLQDAPGCDVCVHAPSLFLTVSIERPAMAGGGEQGRATDGGHGSAPDRDEMHFHPGGQGFWVARLLEHLGVRPVIVSPIGGESGSVLRGLVHTWGVGLRAVPVADDSPVYVHDRRDGERREIARSAMPSLNRHEVDDLYGAVLETATRAGVCVVTGKFPGDSTPYDFYTRLGADLDAIGTPAIGDLHRAELDALLAGGPLHTLKVSDQDLVKDGLFDEGAGRDERVEAARRLMERGARRVVVSSAEGQTIYVDERGAYAARPPSLRPADASGSGDSMTAALAFAALRNLDPTEAIRLACAAGAANVTRHGLGNADAGFVQSLAERVEVERL